MTVIRYKTLSEQLYADSDYLTKLANKPSMREHCQEIINATVDINRAAFQIKQQEKTGKWINDWEMGMSECSCCGETYLWEDHKGTEDFHYCPNCGARMVSE